MFNKKLGILHWLLLCCLTVIAQVAEAAPLPGYTVLETITYEYDAAGNRLSKSATVAGVPETPIVAQYDQSNRLTQLTLKGQGSNGADLNCTLSYDANGNLTNKSCADVGSTATSTTRYIWDARNRLIQIDGPGVQVQFQYDALGRRTERALNGDSTQYLYDGSQAIAELKNNAVTAVNLTGLAIDEVIARYTSQGERTLLTDALGGILITTKEDASIVTAYGYSPYGETQVMGTDEQNPVQYTARENDQAGLYYYRARYYDPQGKRFISEDPIGIDGGLDVYAYVNENPLSRIDPLGLDWVYAQSTGQLTHVDPSGTSTNVGSGYSGHGEGVNNPALQNVPDVGPIPQGTYTIQPQQNNTTGSGTNLPGSMRLTPQNGTDTLGRGGFLIHGDNSRGNQSASHGCVILKPNIRNQIGGSGDNTLRVVP